MLVNSDVINSYCTGLFLKIIDLLVNQLNILFLWVMTFLKYDGQFDFLSLLYKVYLPKMKLNGPS